MLLVAAKPSAEERKSVKLNIDNKGVGSLQRCWFTTKELVHDKGVGSRQRCWFTTKVLVHE